MKERFFILTPTPTSETETTNRGQVFAIYLDASGLRMKWSGDFPIPAVGSRVFVTMNGIGWAVVKGYFESCGYVGLMTLPTRPPKWLRAQNKRALGDSRPRPEWMKQGIGCEFGIELALKRPKKKEVAA